MTEKSKKLKEIISKINDIFNDRDYNDYSNRYDDHDIFNHANDDEMSDLWEEKYDDIFAYSSVIGELTDFKFEDPETTYFEICQAYVEALNAMEIK